MALRDDLTNDVSGVLSQTWDIRDGTTVPSTDTVVLAGGGVKLEATMLYADLADSTELAMWDRRVTARLCKAFLAGCSRIIKDRGGAVRSFDGDRVMGVFLGDQKNTSAVKCALQINWFFLNLIKPKFDTQYDAFKKGTYKLAHCTGVDVSDVLTVRAGVRNSNDLIWIGRAPNVAAKLSAFRDAPYYSFITGEVYDKMSDTSKLTDGKSMWRNEPGLRDPSKGYFAQVGLGSHSLQ